jgi:hypothetical protein
MFEDEDELQVVRHHNRVVRKVNKLLRTAQKKAQEDMDNMFLELCSMDMEAELAMEKLRTLGQIECGPRDYDKIVEVCLAALNVTKPIDQN